MVDKFASILAGIHTAARAGHRGSEGVISTPPVQRWSLRCGQSSRAYSTGPPLSAQTIDALRSGAGGHGMSDLTAIDHPPRADAASDARPCGPRGNSAHASSVPSPPGFPSRREPPAARTRSQQRYSTHQAEPRTRSTRRSRRALDARPPALSVSPSARRYTQARGSAALGRPPRQATRLPQTRPRGAQSSRAALI